MANFATRPVLLGTDLALSTTTQEHPLGLRVSDELGNEYVYIQANGAIAVSDSIKVDGAYDCAPLTGAGLIFAVAVVAIADNSYGFVQTRGVVVANVATSTADNASLTPVADSSGDFVTVAAATGVTSAQALSAESGGLATVYLF